MLLPADLMLLSGSSGASRNEVDAAALRPEAEGTATGSWLAGDDLADSGTDARDAPRVLINKILSQMSGEQSDAFAADFVDNLRELVPLEKSSDMLAGLTASSAIMPQTATDPADQVSVNWSVDELLKFSAQLMDSGNSLPPDEQNLPQVLASALAALQGLTPEDSRAGVTTTPVSGTAALSGETALSGTAALSGETALSGFSASALSETPLSWASQTALSGAAAPDPAAALPMGRNSQTALSGESALSGTTALSGDGFSESALSGETALSGTTALSGETTPNGSLPVATGTAADSPTTAGPLTPLSDPDRSAARQATPPGLQGPSTNQSVETSAMLSSSTDTTTRMQAAQDSAAITEAESLRSVVSQAGAATPAVAVTGAVEGAAAGAGTNPELAKTGNAESSAHVRSPGETATPLSINADNQMSRTRQAQSAAMMAASANAMSAGDTNLTGSAESAGSRADAAQTLVSAAPTASELATDLYGADQRRQVAQQSREATVVAQQQPLAQARVLAEGLLSQSGSFGHASWGEGIGRQLLIMSANGVNSAQIRLDPPELGTLTVRVQMTDQAATVHFVSQHAMVRDALEQQLPRLQDMFRGEGVELLDASVSDQSAQQRGSDSGASQSGDDNARRSATAGPEADSPAGTHVEQAVLRSSSLIDFYA